jgi:hypothetical protein
MENINRSTPNQDTQDTKGSQQVQDKVMPYIMAFNPAPATNPEFFFSVYDGQTWSRTQRVQYQGQSIKGVADPVVIEWNNLIHLFYTGLDRFMYKSTFDGLNWSQPSPVLPGLKAASHPAVTILNNKLYLAYRGDGSNQIYFASDVGGPQESFHLVQGIGSSGPPDLTTYNGRVMMAWKGVPGDLGIYWMFPEVSGASQSRIQGVGSDLGVSLTATSVGEVVMVWLGVRDDKRIWCSSYTDASGWYPQRLAVPGDAFGVPGISVYNGKVIMSWVKLGGSHVFLSDESRYLPIPGQPLPPIVGFENHRDTGQVAYWTPSLTRRY